MSREKKKNKGSRDTPVPPLAGRRYYLQAEELLQESSKVAKCAGPLAELGPDGWTQPASGDLYQQEKG